MLTLFGSENFTDDSLIAEHDEIELLLDYAEEHTAGGERRQAPRQPLPSGTAGTTATGHLVEVLNASPGGMLLRSVHPVRAGERHMLRLPDPDEGCVTLQVDVVHTEEVAEPWGHFVLAGVALRQRNHN